MTIWFSANNTSSKTKKKPVLQFSIIALFQKSIKCFPFGYIWMRLPHPHLNPPPSRGRRREQKSFPQGGGNKNNNSPFKGEEMIGDHHWLKGKNEILNLKTKNK
jgi:hypothetical protein